MPVDRGSEPVELESDTRSSQTSGALGAFAFGPENNSLVYRIDTEKANANDVCAARLEVQPRRRGLSR